jgi:hypothetical protein
VLLVYRAEDGFERGLGGMKLTDVAQDRDKKRALVSTVMNLLN